MKTLMVAMILVTNNLVQAQEWANLSKEEKISKGQEFRADNQNYLRNTLGMTEEQLTDIDNVNLCYLSTLDRINRYAKTDDAKEKYAKSITEGRSVQLDAIMGPDKRKKYIEYVKEKLKKVQ